MRAIFLIALLAFAQEAVAQTTSDALPVPPCAGAPSPAYPAPGPMPEVRVWRDAELKNWQAPVCLGFGSLQPNSVIATAGRFESVGGVAAVAERLARISALTTIRYYSVTEDAWKQLFTQARALGDVPEPGAADVTRGDFGAEDLEAGRTLRYAQKENSMLSSVVYRLTVTERTQDRFVYSIVNESPASVMFLTVGESGDFRQHYVVEREAGDLWRYYSLAAARIRTGPFSPSTRSFINRAVAYYRHVAGQSGEPEVRPAP